MEFGFARVTTPRAWLSTWSGLSSNAAVERNGPRVAVPVDRGEPTRRQRHLPQRRAGRASPPSAAADKQIANAPGDHYGFGVGTRVRTDAPIASSTIVGVAARSIPG